MAKCASIDLCRRYKYCRTDIVRGRPLVGPPHDVEMNLLHLLDGGRKPFFDARVIAAHDAPVGGDLGGKDSFPLQSRDDDQVPCLAGITAEVAEPGAIGC